MKLKKSVLLGSILTVSSVMASADFAVPFLGEVTNDMVAFRTCASKECNIQEMLNKASKTILVDKKKDYYQTFDGLWVNYKYITFKKPLRFDTTNQLSYLNDTTKNPLDEIAKLDPNNVLMPFNKDIDLNLVTSNKQNIINAEKNLATSTLYQHKMETENTSYVNDSIKQTHEDVKVKKNNSLPISNEEQNDNILTHSGELAEKYPNEALVANLTKTPSSLPVFKEPRYARVLLMPILNKTGDIYTDYTYAWVKIKDQEFVLGKREGKGAELKNNFFTIHNSIE